ncbi:TetR/AcrR family transcriptional regulator [Pseudonocardia spinosispora]|uniref:TetR/AcrR family transcriptional regulator n=1 Tax=Pseudonocardia spinosispora TaxID=103441 RepID=UPI000419E72B|nr:TetR/AcrR family transcriptional regulator [Pseudonocardia spinosispora]
MSVHLRLPDGDTAGQRNKRGAQQREELICAALRIIARDGVSAVSHHSVTTEANAAAGAVIHHFGSRETLIEQTLEYLAHLCIERLRSDWPRFEPMADRPTRFADMLCTFFLDQLRTDRDLGIAALELQVASAREPRLRSVFAEWGRGYADITEETLRALGSGDPRTDMAQLVNVINGLLAGQLALPRRDFEHTIMRPAVRSIVHSMVLGPPPAPAPRFAGQCG